MEIFAFMILGFISILAGIMMITSRKVVFSVFWLLVSFFATACIFLLVHAEFLAVVQILVNAGAVIISFLFVVILTSLREEPRAERYHKQKTIATAICIALLVLLGFLLVPQGKYLKQPGDILALQMDKWGGNSELIGRFLFTDYIFPFEVIAIVLLVAVIGVVVLGKKLPAEKKADE